MKNTQEKGRRGRFQVRRLAVTAMLSAIAFILMFMEFHVPFMPSFIAMDISELPALIGTFSLGPLCGIEICLLKNVIHLFVTSTGGVGEISNFMLGVAFVLPAGLIYKKFHSWKGAWLASLSGAVIMAVLSVVTNYFIVYPVYYNFMKEEIVLKAYQVIYPGVSSILQALIVFNVPFTFVKGMICAIITCLMYRHILPIIHEIGNPEME